MASIGSIIDGKYEILKEIGRGGMSTVYLAMDISLNKQWAIKEIKKVNEDETSDITAYNSLLVEANLMKRLDHPALPRIVGIVENEEVIYIVMDYIEGESLDRILTMEGPQSQERVIDWAKQLADALGYLHNQKPPIVYRDMKPSNVMLKPEGNLKIIDFGIAREYKDNKLKDTTVMGTNGYASPEQHGSRQTDPRSDIFSLGMTMHHLLTGEDPRKNGYVYLSVREWRPDLSGGLERIIDKCTALNPNDRYSNCNELLYALEHFEQEDDSFRHKQKRRMGVFIITASVCVFCFVVGLAAMFLKTREMHNDYDLLVDISSSTPYETKIATYAEAIEIYGNNPEAYIKMIDAFEENGIFTDEECNYFFSFYNRNKSEFKQDEKFLELNYRIGEIYMYLYTGGDNSFRTRILKASPFFEVVVLSGNEDFEYYELANSYWLLGNFYSKYVLNVTSVKEPGQLEYNDLLSSIEVCVSNVEGYEGDDSAYTQLVMYKEIINLLGEHRKGFALAEISKWKVTNLVNKIEENAADLFVTQEKTLMLQESIPSACEECRILIDGTYRNMSKI